MANWFLEECAYCGTPTWCRSDLTGWPQCRACGVCSFYDDVLLAPLGNKLLPWQRRELRAIYGPCEADAPDRLIWDAYICVPKKNGKTYLIAGLPIYHLAMEADEIVRPVAVSAASARKQAKLIFAESAAMIQQSPELLRMFKIIASQGRFIRRDGNGVYQALSVDGAVNDGEGPSLVIEDEFHRFHTAKAETLDDVLSKGQDGRGKNRLRIKITTAGSIYESELWAAEHERAKQQIAGIRHERRYYAKIYQADPQRAHKDPAYWHSREARVAANPSHEDNGGFMLDEGLAMEAAEARENPKKRMAYFRYRLNIETTTSGIKAIEPHVWAQCAAPDPQDRPSTVGRRCFGGADLSLRTDLTSFALFYPPDEHEPRAYLKTWSWIPSEEVHHLSAVCHVPFAKWIEEDGGHLIACEGQECNYGATISQTQVEEFIKSWRDDGLVEVGYDAHMAEKWAESLRTESVTMIDVPQNFQSFAEPLTLFLEMLATRRIVHDGSMLETWAADCLRIASNPQGHYRPVKPNKNKEKFRIDPLVATLMAMFCWLRHDGQRSIYDTGVDVVQVG